jgi:hypothetical protein
VVFWWDRLQTCATKKSPDSVVDECDYRKRGADFPAPRAFCCHDEFVVSARERIASKRGGTMLYGMVSSAARGNSAHALWVRPTRE